MSNFKYEMTELAKFDGFDAVSAAKNFNNQQDYFDKLTDFVENSPNYLPSYNPAVVIYSEEVREEFFVKLKEIQNILELLGLGRTILVIENLRDAVNQKSPGILSDRLIQFQAEMEITAKHIASVRIPEDNTQPETKAARHIGEKPIIMAIDDKPEILTTITTLLESKYKVIAMTDGNVAIKAMNVYSPVLFLLDIEMPIINGYELAKHIRAQEKFKNTPIMFLTGKSSRDNVVTAKVYGGNDYILKPVEKNLLLNKIESHLGSV